MRRYLFLVSTTAPEPNDGIMVEVSAQSEAEGVIAAQRVAMTRGFDPVHVRWFSDWREAYSAPVVTFKETI